MNPNVQPSNPNIFGRLTLAGALLVGAGALAACSNDGSDIKYQGSGVESTVLASAETLQGVEAACGTALNLEANSANTTYAGPEALLPSLATVESDGKQNLFTAAGASNTLQMQVATDARVLATLKAVFIETRSERQLPGAQTITRIGDLVNTYKTNSQAAADAAIEVCAALDETFIIPTSDFAVTKGQATEFITVRDESGKIVEIKTQTIQNTASLEGFTVGFNLDDSNLTAEQIALFKKLQSLALITKDGTVVINQTIGEGSITVEDFEDKTTAQPNPSDSTLPANNSGTTSNEGTNNGSTPANGTTVVTTPSAGTNGGGGNGGGGNAPTQPSTPDAPGQPDTTGTPTDVPGTTPGTNPNTVPSTTTPNTTSTTVKPTTTTTTTPPTVPPTTMPPVVTTTTVPITTTTQPKGPAPTTSLPQGF
ncbi:hypothetical protein EB118_06445 [bacterium]|nr:hypothetical protein [bacterium]NBX97715.1 hypothetical protein [bacterium]NDC94212.1 hypothetical protein [bacterium]NDD84401.1 hypothetical protein [bacterium]NDG29717.1 hypothetical protein [bacterium]